MTNRKLRYTGLGLAVLTAGAIVACSSSDSGTPGGGAGSSPAGGSHAGGASGAGTTAGAPGTAGAGVAGSAAGAAPTAGTGGGAAVGYPCAGTLPTAALITDFSNLMPNATTAGQYTFTGGVLGGTFTYQTGALTLDTMTNTVLNIKGNVANYDGFGIYFNTCYDASLYTGVSFNIKGNVGPTGKLNFRVQTNSDTPVGDASNPKGTCVPTDKNNAYPDCHAASIDITVPPAGGVVTVNFSQLTAGVPVATVSAKEIVGLEWAFNWTPPPAGGAGAGAGGASAGSGGASAGSGGAKGGAGGAPGASAGAGGAAPGPYDANVTIDDIMFLGGPPAGGAGGAGGAGASAGAGGASAGAGGASAGTGGKAGAGGTGGKAGTGGA